MIESIKKNPIKFYSFKLKNMSLQDKLEVLKVFLSQDTYGIPVELYENLLKEERDITNRLLLSKRFIRYGQNPKLGENRCFTK
jgi:hypothetical protein